MLVTYVQQMDLFSVTPVHIQYYIIFLHCKVIEEFESSNIYTDDNRLIISSSSCNFQLPHVAACV